MVVGVYMSCVSVSLSYSGLTHLIWAQARAHHKHEKVARARLVSFGILFELIYFRFWPS
jgi:hypothetical protein